MTRAHLLRPPLASRVVIVALLTLGALPLCGFIDQAAPAAAVKAAFLFNFAKFTELPGLSPGSPITYCVAGDDSVLSALSDTLRDQQIGGRALRVRSAGDASTWARCKVLFLSEGEWAIAAPALGGLRDTPVLTVSDAAGFARVDGIAELYLEGGRMRFAVNVQSAERAGLRLSSRLLSLAKVVRPGGAQ